jgi:hypothetical protein
MTNEEQDIGGAVVDRETEQDFTPGTWEVKESRVPGYSRNIDVVAGDLLVCEVSGGGVSNPVVLAQVRANARLLAASKSLYRAAMSAARAVEFLPPDVLGRDAAEGYFYRDELLSELRAALALVNKPDTNSANSTGPAHGPASEQKVLDQLK